MKKTILITGSSSGIGKATVKYFQAEGWNVIATMRRPEEDTELRALDNVLVTRLDVQDDNTIQTAITEGIAQFGTIDVLLNNAGYGLMGTFESIDRASIQRQFDVNVFGLFDVTRAILPHFRAQNKGVIINISSVGGRMAFPLISPYHATKFAVEGFSESLRYELEPLGIQVKIVEPGAIATDFGGRSLDFQHNQELTDYNDYVGRFMGSFEAMTDPKMMSTPSLVAEVIFEAATDSKKTVRYVAGADAKQWLATKQEMEDADFADMITTQFNLN